MIAIWDNRLAIGDAAIDAEHRHVLNLLNELDVALSVKAPEVVVEKALETLVKTVERHFARDRRRGLGPPAVHAAFTAKVQRLLADWRAGDHRAVDHRVLLGLGRRWLDHMGRSERRGGTACIGIRAVENRRIL